MPIPRLPARTLALLIVLVGIAPLNAGELTATKRTTVPTTLTALDTAIKQALAADGVPGASVVVIENGQIVFSKGYGVADVATGRQVNADTVFRAGSISKTFTAMGIMHLVEQGRLALNTPVQTLLPEWEVLNPWSNRHAIHLAHLLEHTAGLDDIRYRHYLIEGREISLREAVPLFGPYALRWAPGHGTAYSNAGPIIAGRIIEIASGQDFERFMATAVTEPMGMASARWGRDVTQADRLATSYQQDGRTPEPYADTPGRPSGSLSATAADLARLPLLLLGRGALDGRRVLNPDSVVRMENASTSVAAQAGAPIGWGLGLRADPVGHALFHLHDGSIDGFVARFAYSPDLGAGYVVMANKASDAAIKAAELIRNYLERGRAPPAVAGRPITPEQRAEWTGQYQSTTPRQELLRAVIGLTQWEGAAFEGDVLRFDRARWNHLGNGLFQRVDAVTPGLQFLESPKGMLAHTTDGTKRRVPGWEQSAKLTIMAATAISLLVSICLLPFWLRDAVKGRLATRGGVTLRLAPLFALGSAVLVPFGVLALLGSGDLNLLGRPTFWGGAVWISSLVAPVVAVIAAMVLWWRRERAIGANRALRWHAVIQLMLAVIVLCWLYTHGWLGIRIWDT